MIQVQIASDVTAAGVSGVRWVLVEQATPTGPAALAPAVTLAATPAPAPTERDWFYLGLFKLLLVLAGLTVALWLARLQLGAPTPPALRNGDTAKPAPPAAPAASGAPAMRLITAGLQ